jgi:hypothetical protein
MKKYMGIFAVIFDFFSLSCLLVGIFVPYVMYRVAQFFVPILFVNNYLRFGSFHDWEMGGLGCVPVPHDPRPRPRLAQGKM